MAKQLPKLSAQILDEASVWFTEFTGGDLDAAAQVEFNTWLRRSPEHVQAYLQIAALWEDADVLKKRTASHLEEVVARAKQEGNVYPFEGAGSVPGQDSEKLKRPTRRVLWMLAASVAVVAIALDWHYVQRGVYSTDIGEQRSVTLDDGSSVELNARSRLRVRFTEKRRGVELLTGQALFHVAKDPDRPFVVESGDTRVRAVGTSFDIYRKHDDTIVTVVEGRVAIAGQSGASIAPVLLQAGEQLTVPISKAMGSAQPPGPQQTNVTAATAWTQKKLVFEGVPLRDVVEEFNRYNRRQLVIRDPELSGFHVSGVFASTDSARMIDVLRRRFAVKLRQSGDDLEIVRDTDAADVQPAP